MNRNDNLNGTATIRHCRRGAQRSQMKLSTKPPTFSSLRGSVEDNGGGPEGCLSGSRTDRHSAGKMPPIKVEANHHVVGIDVCTHPPKVERGDGQRRDKSQGVAVGRYPNVEGGTRTKDSGNDRLSTLNAVGKARDPNSVNVIGTVHVATSRSRARHNFVKSMVVWVDGEESDILSRAQSCGCQSRNGEKRS